MKIANGSVKSACDGSQLTTFAASDDAKMIGAVSPATRATASSVPVTIPPSDDGMTTLTTVFHLRAPSAALASRSETGTSPSTSCVDRAISGTSMIASATPAIQAA